MAEENEENKTACETYLPLTLATAGAITGAIEGFFVGGPILGSIPSAAFQAAGGHTIGKWVCENVIDVETPTATPRPGTEIAQLPKQEHGRGG